MFFHLNASDNKQVFKRKSKFKFNSSKIIIENDSFAGIKTEMLNLRDQID